MNLKHSPLVEALYEVTFEHKFEEYDPTLPGLFFAKVSDQFIDKKEIVGFEYEITDNDGNTRTIKNPYTRFNDNKGNFIQFTKDLIFFNKVEPKINWLDFKKNIVTNLEKYIEVNQNNVKSFSCLRFVNIIKVPVDDLMSDYLTFSHAIPGNEKFSEVKNFHYQTSFTYEGSYAKIEVKSISQSTDGENRLMLEISVEEEANVTYDREQENKWLQTSHDKILEIFKNCLTEKSKDRYECC